MKNYSLIVFALLSSLRTDILKLFAVALFLSSCAGSPPDVPLCVEISPTRGWCTNTVSNKEFEINDKNPYSFSEGQKPMTWWELRPTFVLVPAPSWAKIKAWIIKSCKGTKQCDKEIDSWERKIDSVDQKINEKKDKK